MHARMYTLASMVQDQITEIDCTCTTSGGLAQKTMNKHSIDYNLKL